MEVFIDCVYLLSALGERSVLSYGGGLGIMQEIFRQQQVLSTEGEDDCGLLIICEIWTVVPCHQNRHETVQSRRICPYSRSRLN